MADLSDLTTGELFEYLKANPHLIPEIAKYDSRVRLMEALDADPEARLDIRKHSKRLWPKANIPEVDVPVLARAAVADDVAAVKKLRKDLEDEAAPRARNGFRDTLRATALELGLVGDDKQLDEIETFMVENHYGPKATGKAVEAFAETRYPAEPNFESEHTFTFPDEGSEYIKALVKAGPGDDTSQLTLRHAEQVYQDMFGKPKGRRPAFVA
jgi:hypothetical protein